MTRTPIAVNAFRSAAGLAESDVVSTPADPSGMVIAGANLGKTIFRVTNTSKRPADVTVLAERPGVSRTRTIDRNATLWFGPFESATFAQRNGDLLIDLDANFAGEVTAFVVPVV